MPRVFTFAYEDSGGLKYTSEKWMTWWNNIGRFRKESIDAKRERDRRYYNNHRDIVLKKRREGYAKTKASSSV